jgi:hydroxymethylpyrimidine/phosphomethylpyrimidine kinase
MTPIALTIAGSDSCGGAGIQADLKTFSALGVYGASVLCALTAQNTHGVSAIHDVPPKFVAQQIEAVLSDLAVRTIKIGMLSQPETIEAVADALARYPGLPIVLDPVMVATSGDRLISLDAIETLRMRLLPMAEIITPNLAEAAELLGTSIAKTEDAMVEQAQALLGFSPKSVLIKGGHGAGATSVDFLVTKTHSIRLSAPRFATKNTHGTGCTLSAALAARLALGDPLEHVAQKCKRFCENNMRQNKELEHRFDSIKTQGALEAAARAAKTYVSGAIEHADQLEIGSGHGPVHHFFALWPK